MTRRDPINRAQRDLDRPARERYATRRLAFESGGATCRGVLHLPASTDDPPLVVLAPDVGAERTAGLPAVAERLAAAGYAAFTFDYRGFGASDGDDRRIAPARQRADLAAAADRARRVDAVGPETVLWGAGLGAAHALRLAGERADVDAAMAITPILDGRAFLRRNRGTKQFLRAVAAGVRDRVGGWAGAGVEVPIVGDPEANAVVTGPGAKRAYLDLVDRESDWRNATPARSLLSLARFRDDALDGVRVPALLLAGTGDAQAPASEAERAADALPNATLVRMPADHWSPYAADFEPAIGHQVAFLRDALDG
ncbi:alpha/beta hydrolase [Haloparvum alkalitolerans]|uniref:alpha/beta hydrolase n=1 Tax=Haloparvum alkalitolerans TaxID=1042953 RepID=UPI003CFB10D9